MDLPRS